MEELCTKFPHSVSWEDVACNDILNFVDSLHRSILTFLITRTVNVKLPYLNYSYFNSDSLVSSLLNKL